MWTAEPAWTAGELLVGAVLIGVLPLIAALGWVLVVPAALAALAAGLRDLILRPTLAADADGLHLVDGVRRVYARWDEVERVRTVRDRRTPLLEVDLGHRVVVLSRRRLGAPVEDVQTALAQLRQVS